MIAPAATVVCMTLAVLALVLIGYRGWSSTPDGVIFERPDPARSRPDRLLIEVVRAVGMDCNFMITAKRYTLVGGVLTFSDPERIEDDPGAAEIVKALASISRAADGNVDDVYIARSRKRKISVIVWCDHRGTETTADDVCKAKIINRGWGCQRRVGVRAADEPRGAFENAYVRPGVDIMPDYYMIASMGSADPTARATDEP